jgi:hypothetical protein
MADPNNLDVSLFMAAVGQTNLATTANKASLVEPLRAVSEEGNTNGRDEQKTSRGASVSV